MESKIEKATPIFEPVNVTITINTVAEAQEFQARMELARPRLVRVSNCLLNGDSNDKSSLTGIDMLRNSLHEYLGKYSIKNDYEE